MVQARRTKLILSVNFRLSLLKPILLVGCSSTLLWTISISVKIIFAELIHF